MSQPIFGYWDIRGFGQPIRFLLAYLGVDYEEKTYQSEKEESWYDVKYSYGMDFPNIPYWIDEKVKLTEKSAILKYLCRKYNPSLIPSQDDIWKTEMLEGVLVDIWDYLVYICYMPGEAAEINFATNYPLKMGQVSKFIGEKTFCLGNSVTYIDFMAYELCYHYLIWNPTSLKPYPNLEKFMKNFEELPAIKNYIKTSPFVKKSCFGKSQQKYFI